MQFTRHTKLAGIGHFTATVQELGEHGGWRAPLPGRRIYDLLEVEVIRGDTGRRAHGRASFAAPENEALRRQKDWKR